MTNPTPTPDSEQELLARQMHEWYLEAIGQLDPKNFNHDAQKSYDQLREQQKDIDRYIAGQVLAVIKADRLRTAKEARIDEANKCHSLAVEYGKDAARAIKIQRIATLQENTDEA